MTADRSCHSGFSSYIESVCLLLFGVPRRLLRAYSSRSLLAGYAQANMRPLAVGAGLLCAGPLRVRAAWPPLCAAVACSDKHELTLIRD